MIKLYNLICEGSRETTALEYLKKLVQTGPFRGRVYLAGGAVRDMEMGMTPKDLDVVVSGDINSGIDFAKWATQYMKNYKDGSNPILFPNFGTAKFTFNGITYNGVDLSKIDVESVATRKEKYNPGSRKPDVSGGDIKDDVFRRDFTTNSLLLDLTNGDILDLTGRGRQDILMGIIRTPMDPDTIFSEDPLRMIRAIRFASKYGWEIEPKTLDGIKRNVSKINNISSERVRDEINKILLSSRVVEGMELLQSTGLLDHIIPEFKQAYKMTQNVHHTSTVWKHTLDVLKKTQPELLNRLMALFHDIGKISTRSVTPTGVHFYQHEDVGSEMVDQIMRKLKYPNELIEAVKLGVKNHMRLKHGGDTAVDLSDKSLRKFKVDVGDKLENVLDLINADNLSHADASSMPNQIANVKKRLDALDVKVSSGKPKLPINGNDLISMGLKPGPLFTDIMTAITDAWFSNPNLSKEEAINIARSVSNK